MNNNVEILIIYEDENMLVINKPAGVSVHGDGRTDEYTVADWVIGKYPETEGVGEDMKTSSGVLVKRPGIVHRLDRDTSGVLVVAKTSEVYYFLKKQFQDREVRKVYNAIVYGTIKESGFIDKPIGRSTGDFRRFATGKSLRGNVREAYTEYSSIVGNDKFTMLEVRPKTGRTHQIRVHLSAIGHPIVCDKLYAKGRTCELGFVRHALHAVSITITDTKGVVLQIEAPLPGDFTKAIKIISTKTSAQN